MTGTASRDDEALNAINGTRRTRVPRWAQEVLGIVVGAAFITFPALWLSDRDRLGDLVHTVKDHAQLFKEVKDFHKEPRWTEKNAMAKIGPVEKEIERLNRRQEMIDKAHRDLLREFYDLCGEVHGLRRKVKD